MVQDISHDAGLYVSEATLVATVASDSSCRRQKVFPLSPLCHYVYDLILFPNAVASWVIVIPMASSDAQQLPLLSVRHLESLDLIVIFNFATISSSYWQNFLPGFVLPQTSADLVSCERGHVMCTACTHVPRVPGVCLARAQARYLTWHCDLEDICPGPRD